MTIPINTFIVYAREDKDIKNRLIDYLRPFSKPFHMVIWHDEVIEAGQEWEKEIKARIENTDLFLLLVSIDFLNSEFINQVEFKCAVERHKLQKSSIIAVIIKHCPWDIDFPLEDGVFTLKDLQVLPTDARPINDWKSADEAYNNIAGEIRKVLVSIKNKREEDKVQKELELRKKEEELQEQTAWESTLKSESIASINEFLKSFPHGKFEVAAKNRLEELKKEKASRKKQEEEQQEKDVWAEAKKKNTISGYREYLKMYPNGRYADTANERIEEFRKESKREKELAAKEAEKDHWNKSMQKNKVSAFEDYLKNYPDGKFAEQARNKINEIKTRIEADKNTIAAIQDYLKSYPGGMYTDEARRLADYLKIYSDGRFAEEARTKINEIKTRIETEKKIWQKSKEKNTVAAIQDYLKSYGAGMYADEARMILNTLSAQPSPGTATFRKPTYTAPPVRPRATPISKVCEECSGSGIIGVKTNCNSCSGTGKVFCNICLGSGKKKKFNLLKLGTEEIVCSSCKGTGNRKCIRCRGTGKRGTLCNACFGTGKVISI